MKAELQILARNIHSEADKWVSGSTGQLMYLHSSLDAAFKDLARLDGFAEHNSASRIRSFTRGFAFNRNLACAAVLLADQRYWRNKHKKSRKPISYEQLIEDAEAVQLFFGERNRSRDKQIKKPDGGTRTVCDWPRAARVRQYAIFLMLKAILPPNPFETRGHRETLARMTDFYKQGYRHFAWFDIKDFFGSVGPQHVRPMLKIHERLLSHCFVPKQSEESLSEFGLGEELSCSQEDRTLPRSDQLHLPQGAAPSSLIASVFLQKLITDLFGDSGPVIVHGDDVTVGGRTMQEALDAANTLIKQLELHHAGPITVHKCGRGTLVRSNEEEYADDDEKSHIGRFNEAPERPYVLAAGLLFRVPWESGPLRAQPSPKSWNRFGSKLRQKIRKAAPLKLWAVDRDKWETTAEGAGRAYIRHFTAAYSVYELHEGAVDRLETSLLSALQDVEDDYGRQRKAYKRDQLTSILTGPVRRFWRYIRQAP